MGIMNNGKGYITEREWQEWKRNKGKKKDFQEYCQIKDCGKPSVQAVITHDAGEKNICSECLKKYFTDVYDWKTEKWRLTDHKIKSKLKRKQFLLIDLLQDLKRRQFLLIDLLQDFVDRYF